MKMCMLWQEGSCKHYYPECEKERMKKTEEVRMESSWYFIDQGLEQYYQ